MPEQNSPIGRILIVDDEALIRWSLSQRLAAAGYEICQAADGASTLAQFHEDSPPFDLVLLDLKLPDTDGVALLKHIKRVCPTCRVILMTAFGAPDAMQEAHDHGVDGVVPKPFDLERMVGVIERALV